MGDGAVGGIRAEATGVLFRREPGRVEGVGVLPMVGMGPTAIGEDDCLISRLDLVFRDGEVVIRRRRGSTAKNAS